MKAISTLRYILFAVMVLGSFANFAQNQYGFMMLSMSHGLLSFLFFLEAFLLLKREFARGKLRAFYLFSEQFLLGCIFMGFFLRFQHLQFAAPFALFGAFFLALLYLIFAIRVLLKETKHGALLSFIVFAFYIAAILVVLGLTFKNQHWPGAYYMMWSAVIGFVLMLGSALIKRKYVYQGEQLGLFKRLMLLPGRPVMTFSYFGLWVLYIFMIMWDIAPNFYTRVMPPAFDQLRTTQYERAETYLDNYNVFINKYSDKE
jgi:hypothetical protein